MKLHIFRWTLDGIKVGANVLELGPGYGISTDLLVPQCGHLTCLESDSGLVLNLEKRLRSAKTTILRGDASSMQLPDAAFDTAVCFMMLHHVTPPPAQDRLFSEVIRVLRPGGTFAGADSASSPILRVLHLFDTVCMIDPAALAARLETVGFEGVEVNTSRYAFRFRARKPPGRVVR